jgi:hypothetical protein
MTLGARRHRPRVQEESPEQYRARIQRSLEEQRAGEERRKREAAARKERAATEREQGTVYVCFVDFVILRSRTERRAAEERQRVKLLNKKAEAKSQRQKDEQTMRLRQQRSQIARSAVFAAARAGDAKKVEKGVWEDDVDAAGGEIKAGCQDFIEVPPNDPLETLLHIAATLGNRDLVKWLAGHGEIKIFQPFRFS